MTTGQFWYDETGKRLKVFGAHDADGLKLLAPHLEIRFITADKRGLPITRKRIVEDMGFALDVVSEAERLAYLENLGFDRTVFMGDGYADAAGLKRCRFGIAPRGARPEACAAADYVTPSRAAEGAVMDACLEILRRFFDPEGAGPLAVAIMAARAGGEIVQRHAGKSVAFEKKPDGSLVSVVDRESEDAIRGILQSRFPEHGFVGEETGASSGNGAVWHVDPLDGTSNYRVGHREACVSIGLARDDEFVLGVVFNPFTDSLFSAEKGKGAFRNGVRLQVSSDAIADGWHLIDSSFQGSNRSSKLRYLAALAERARRVRMIGSNALQLVEVASGHCVSSLSDTIRSYDFAAGVVIVQEAGGIVTSLDGQPPSPASRVLLASSSVSIHEELLALVRASYSGV